MKELFLTTQDHKKIAINHYEKPDRDCVLIIAHGICMAKDTRPFLALSEDMFNYLDVITMDFRGHGKSSGLFSFTSREPLDMIAVVDYARKKYKKVALMGYSLGGAISIIHGGTQKNVDSIIAVSAPVDFFKVENHCFLPDSFIPTFEKFEFGKTLVIRPGNMFGKKIKPIDVVGNISPIPLLIVSGTRDVVVYPWHAKKLFEKARDPKEFLELKGGLHAEDMYLKMKDQFLSPCVNWIKKTLEN